MVNAYALAFAALLVVLGRAADRIGRRRVYLGGVALFAVASAACAVAASPGALIAARTVQGVAAAAMIPAALALLLAAFPPQQWARAIAAWGAVSAVAAGLGPPLGGLLVEAGSWRWIFVINVPVGLITVWLGMRRLRESRAAETAPPDLPGAVLLAGATGALALALVQGETWGWSSAATLGTFGAALVIGGLLVARTRRIEAPVLEPALLRTRWVRAANAGTMAFGAALFAANLCLVLFATSVWGWTALETGIAAVPGALASAVAAPLGGRWATRSGPRPVAAVGAALFAAALTWMLAMAGEEANLFGVWLPYQLVAGVGIGLGLPTLIGATASGLPADALRDRHGARHHRPSARRRARRGAAGGGDRHAGARRRAGRLRRGLRPVCDRGHARRRRGDAARPAAGAGRRDQPGGANRIVIRVKSIVQR